MPFDTKKIERLRELAHMGTTYEDLPLLAQAADEIEGLREELAHYKRLEAEFSR